MHLTDAELAALAHGDASAPSSHAFSHIAQCPECSARLDALRAADREVAALLRGLDHPAPRLGSASFLDDLKQRRRRRAGAIAAALAFCVAGAAAALPNSPLHQLLLRALSRTETGRIAETAPNSSSVRPKHGTGVGVMPGNSAAVIFRSPRPGGHLRIVLVDGPRMSVTADGDAAFSIHQSQLEVTDRGVAMNFTLEIPRTVSDVRVQADNETIFEKRAGAISGSYPVDSSGAYVFEFAGVPPAVVRKVQ